MLTTTAAGSREINPFINGSPTDTPFISDPAGRAEIYGLSDGIDLTATFLNGLRAAFPVGTSLNTTGALMRIEPGPAPVYDDNFAGFDTLLFVRATCNTLSG